MTEYLVEQTKDLHLNVVRADLGVLRHLHPTMADDGTWTAPVSLPGVGAYRVIAEFVAAARVETVTTSSSARHER